LPAAHILLAENFRPVYQLSLPEQKNNATTQSVVWIPTLERMLEDLLVMIALYIERDPEICQMAEQYFGVSHPKRVELYEAMDESTRTQFYEACQKIKYTHCFNILMIDQPTIENQLHVLTKYHIDSNVYELVKKN